MHRLLGRMISGPIVNQLMAYVFVLNNRGNMLVKKYKWYIVISIMQRMHALGINSWMVETVGVGKSWD